MGDGEPQERANKSQSKTPAPPTDAAGAGTCVPQRRRKRSFTVEPSYRPPVETKTNRPPEAQHEALRSFDLETVIEGASLFVHGTLGLIAHTLNMVPENPIKAVGFVAVLILGAMAVGIEHHESEEFCFRCIFVLAVIAVGLIVICLKNPGSNDRLREMQDERMKAVAVTPFRYTP